MLQLGEILPGRSTTCVLCGKARDSPTGVQKVNVIVVDSNEVLCDINSYCSRDKMHAITMQTPACVKTASMRKTVVR